MISFEISKDMRVVESDLFIRFVSNIDELNLVIDDVDKLINQFNSEYEWDNMFTINDVVNRVLENEKLFILYYKKIAIGYVFFKKTFYDSYFGYNLYVSKKIKRPKYAAYWFYNNVTNIMLEYSNKIEVEVDEWNWVIIDIIKNIGYYKVIKK